MLFSSDVMFYLYSYEQNKKLEEIDEKKTNSMGKTNLIGLCSFVEKYFGEKIE